MESFNVYSIRIKSFIRGEWYDGTDAMWVDSDDFPVEDFDPEDGCEMYDGKFVFVADFNDTGDEGRIAEEAELWHPARDVAEREFSFLDDSDLDTFRWDVSYIGRIEENQKPAYESVTDLMDAVVDFGAKDSGIVCFPESMEAIACNWTNVLGIPRMSVFAGDIMGIGDVLTVSRCFDVDSWKDFVSDYEFVFDSTKGIEDEEDCWAAVVELDSGEYIVAPIEWV